MSEARQFIGAGNAQGPFYVGIDVGGTSAKLGVVDDLGRPLSALSVATQIAEGPRAGVQRIAAGVRQAIADAGLRQAQIAAIGLGTAGTIDAAAGLLLGPVNLPGWENFPIRDEISRACGLRVLYCNDATAAGYGEFWVGTGRQLNSMVMFTLGTGVGGAIIIDDASIAGSHGNAGELGHMTIDYNESARQCGCGQRGHLEAYVGALGVVGRARDLLAGDNASSVLERVAQGEPLTPRVLAEEAEIGDPLALDIVLKTADYLAIGVVNAMHTVDPAGVVIGGAMTFGGHETPIGRRFLDRVRSEVRRRALPALAERTTIDFASLGSDAGFIGAAGLARRAYGQLDPGQNH
ncbi:MAG TPA: ROK family protein [Pirellulales bacterium]|jgi:glucokinase